MRFVDASVLVAVFGSLLLAACSAGEKEGGAVPDGPPEGPHATEVARLDDARYLGEPITVDNLTVWPVFTDAPLEIGDFLTLGEAQAEGVAVVRELGGTGGQQRGLQQGANGIRQIEIAGAQVDVEVQQEEEGGNAAPQQRGNVRNVAQQLGGGAQSAEVGRLVVENKSDRPLLICAGTVVKGGNQDRQIGQDVVVAAGESIDVDAFCVEAGRWTNMREGVANDGAFEVAGAMAPASVRTKGQYLKNQQEVWSEVAQARAVAFAGNQIAAGQPRVDARGGSTVVDGGEWNGTTLVDALEEVGDDAAKARQALRDRVTAHFRELGNAVGFAYAVNGQPVTVRAFAHSRLLEKHLGAFAETMAIEAQAAETDDAFDAPTAGDIVAMVAEINEASEKLEQTRASNVNGLRLAEFGFNSNCYFDDEDGKKVPVTQDWTRR